MPRAPAATRRPSARAAGPTRSASYTPRANTAPGARTAGFGDLAPSTPDSGVALVLRAYLISDGFNRQIGLPPQPAVVPVARSNTNSAMWCEHLSDSSVLLVL